MNRRDYLHTAALIGLAPFIPSWITMKDTIQKRLIPSTGERLPCVGVGTWQTFDVGENDSERNPLKEVLKLLVENGGSVIDSSPMYGRSEKVVGDLSAELNLNEKLFIATKVWTSGKEDGIQQMKQSFLKLRRQKMDLMQIHNLVDWQTHLKTLRNWKEEGKIRYIGITHYTESAYSSIEQILKEHPLDFLQINYSILSRKAEERLFPLAQDKKVAVIINRPYEEGVLFQRVKARALPMWAGEFDCKSWGQFFLKFILSHPAVTCVIPGTDKPHHLLDNAAAGFGRLPDEKQRNKMIEFMQR